jgi:hypothetical protein
MSLPAGARQCGYPYAGIPVPGHCALTHGRCAIGEEFLYCVKAAGFASRSRGLRTGMRPSAGPALSHIDKTKG